MKEQTSKRIRKRHSAEFKTKVVLAALREDKTQSQLASEYGIHPLQITQWKKAVIEAMPTVFGMRRNHSLVEQEELERQLYERIGRLETELAWLKNKVGPLA